MCHNSTCCALPLLLLLLQGADPNLPNHDGWHALDLACDLNKLGKVVVKQQHVPVHALLVGWGAVNSDAFRAQVRRDHPASHLAECFAHDLAVGLLLLSYLLSVSVCVGGGVGMHAALC
jgi:hypothetical protein